MKESYDEEESISLRDEPVVKQPVSYRRSVGACLLCLAFCIGLNLASFFHDYYQLKTEASDVSKYDYCAMNFKSSMASAIQINEIATKRINETYCLANTSLIQTASQFSRQEATIWDPGVGDNHRIDEIEWAKAGTIALTFHFQALDEEGHFIGHGGEEFVITFSGWFPTNKAFKTAMYSTEKEDGWYEVTIRVPKVSIQSYNVSLMHYYTCYEGFGYYGTQGKNFKGMSSTIDFGPIAIELPQNAKKYLSEMSKWIDPQELLDRRPECSPTQQGVDSLMSGLWMDSGVPSLQEISVAARWEPFCCRPVLVAPKEIRFHRIGSSTMPRQSVQVGDVYNVKQPFHERWVQFLLHNLPSGTSNDTLVFSAGLHQLLYGYNVATALELVQRMLCQIGAVFAGKIIVLGPCPVQQQQFAKVDMTDQQTLLFNSGFRRKVSRYGGDLDRFCQNTVSLSSLISYPDEATGNRVDDETEAAKYARDQKTYNETEDEVELVKILKSTTSWGNRHVYFAEIDHFLRPRPETYREHDKVHDMRAFSNGMLFVGEHDKIITDLLNLRALGGP